jgi:2-keto-4-pentenoate hydratase/2-oxohepta-3-ene-1,7-dioic acid hydratase in catechol pathway
LKLVTYSPAAGGTPRPGLVLDGERIADIPAHAAATPGVDFSTMLGIIRGGAAARKALDALAAKPPADTVAMTEEKLHAPIPRPAKNDFSVGWNYLEHYE